jgi:hypothetical protein
MKHWKSKQKPNQAIGKPVRERNQELLNTVLRDVPHDGADHTVEMVVRWEAFEVIIQNKELRIDGEPLTSE